MSETIIIRRTGQAPLRVRGEVIVSTGTSMNKRSPRLQRLFGRATDVQLIRTATGKFVVAIHHSTAWRGAHGTDEAAVYPRLTQCIEYLSDRVPEWLIDEIIDEIGKVKRNPEWLIDEIFKEIREDLVYQPGGAIDEFIKLLGEDLDKIFAEVVD